MRSAVYPFLARHLGLDASLAENAGKLEAGIVLEGIEDLYPFDEVNPVPENLVRKNEDLDWE